MPSKKELYFACPPPSPATTSPKPPKRPNRPNRPLRWKSIWIPCPPPPPIYCQGAFQKRKTFHRLFLCLLQQNQQRKRKFEERMVEGDRRLLPEKRKSLNPGSCPTESMAGKRLEFSAMAGTLPSLTLVHLPFHSPTHSFANTLSFCFFRLLFFKKQKINNYDLSGIWYVVGRKGKEGKNLIKY